MTGCGNALDLSHPRVLQMVTDSLRYWAGEVGVDGFRFDLASTLGRNGEHQFDPRAPFFEAIAQDPLLAHAKLIAEPWDLGADGYRVGGFPPGWSEWNDRFRDDIRRYWRGDEGVLGDLAARLSGSADRFDHDGRRPWSSVNFVTAHDGFTLMDLVSYDAPRNEANGENGQDGARDNKSWNCGVDGPTDDPEIVGLRARQRRNLLATLLLAQGVPMLLGGDELGRTQDGNNNAYCQDNPISWFDWAAAEPDLIAFTAQLIEIRRRHPVFRRHRFLHGQPTASGRPDIAWYAPNGQPMRPEDWSAGFARCLGALLGPELGEEGPFLMLFNAHHDRLDFVLPDPAPHERWHAVLDTAGAADPGACGGGAYPLAGRSAVLLQAVPG